MHAPTTTVNVHVDTTVPIRASRVNESLTRIQFGWPVGPSLILDPGALRHLGDVVQAEISRAS